ncbi:MAG: alpha-ketoglutarate-dependent dioxygenase AlkB [Methylicorpusculum sp.]|uniref:alpha-ketoglutarate-dependent dioxygenase AlkB family protein n=1 Tax=Methylicorpusculum sp. TaxID=2713644 RepID=UPI00272FE5FF|nr:alpha-ketoglutarate-dependent dioxygenase AlkB [Methylicorpusculum sp.]MDP2200384.1 alpha-ketoglutarate-dependent dioxygenase AlkB [Methylicorpusculum sp.]
MQCSELELIEDFYDAGECTRLLHYFLKQHAWPDNRYEYGGRRFVLPRLQTWHADAGIRYNYSNNLLVTRPWNVVLSRLRADVETKLKQAFNAVLVNCYRNGEDHVSWHADNEPELGESPCIASLSLGATRVFSCRHNRTLNTERILLAAGSLLVMRPGFQRDWQHSVPTEHGILNPRINLTFRKVIEPAVVANSLNWEA